MSEKTNAISWIERLLVVAGGGALLVAMATDFLAVIGRHTGHPFLGSIEVVQAAVLVAGSVGLVLASLKAAHAIVHLLVERLPAGAHDGVRRVNLLVASVFFIAMAAGSLWIARDMWSGFEHSEVLAIPYAPLRLIACAATGLAALIFIVQALAPAKREPKP